MIVNEFEITKEYFLSDVIDYNHWRQFSLFHKLTNESGGSVCTSIGRIEVFNKPWAEGINKHIEVRMIMHNYKHNDSIYTDIEKYNPKKIITYDINEVIDNKILEKIEHFLVENNFVFEPYTCQYSIEVKNCEDWHYKGELFNDD